MGELRTVHSLSFAQRPRLLSSKMGTICGISPQPVDLMTSPRNVKIQLNWGTLLVVRKTPHTSGY